MQNLKNIHSSIRLSIQYFEKLMGPKLIRSFDVVPVPFKSNNFFKNHDKDITNP